MDAKTIKTYPAGSREWLDQRRNALGGSEIAVVMGLSPYKSHYALWWEKQGHDPAGMSPVRAAIGHGLESVAAALFEQHHPEYKTFKSGCWQSKTRPWQLAEPDRFTCPTGTRKKTGFIEIKTVDPSVAWQWGKTGAGPEGIPQHYLTQVQWYMSTLGLRQAWLVALVGFGEYREYEIPYMPELVEKMLDSARKFVDSLREHRVPDIDKTNSTYQMVRELHPDILADQTIDLDEDTVREFVEAADSLKAAEERMTGVKTRLADAMGNAQYAQWEGTRIARRQAKGSNPPYVTGSVKGMDSARKLLELKA